MSALSAHLFALVLAVALAGVFAPALMHKVQQWQRFLPQMQAYQLLPPGLIKPAAAILVLIEASTLGLLTVGWLFDGVGLGFALATVLLALYALAMTVNVIRGRKFIDCGCGDAPTAIGRGVLIRNAILIVAALCGWSLLQNGTVAMTPLAYLAGIGFGLVGAFLYASYEQVLANISLHRRLWLGEQT